MNNKDMQLSDERQPTIEAMPMLCEVFSSKKELAKFIRQNIPICVKPTKKSKTALVGVFKSQNAMMQVVEFLTDKLWEKLS